MNKINACPFCGCGESTEFVFDDEQIIGGLAAKIPLHMRQCSNCGSEFTSEEDSRKNHRALIAHKRRTLDFVTAKRILALRNKYGITQKQAGQIFGGGPVAFSKYERDELCQSEQMDRLLVGAEEFPAFFALLCRRANVHVEGVNVLKGRSEMSTTTDAESNANLTSHSYYPKIHRQHVDSRVKHG
ncbi:type II toxin-antitoxin system MqsA family antitoxin [Comamonas sp. BIGb0124]|uniref:type II toxin-antitoxin system MqsA family antitoxin n=1 Tax=Comamonas sp. BIGb0124 TaxID=2485130 RepID=UPI000F46D441|nr:type II toxin-antitoxin system MqsA family antitoxin [Comamonas sp. BIGb0124]